MSQDLFSVHLPWHPRTRDWHCQRSVLCGLVAKLCLTLASQQTVASQAPLSMGFSRQEYWSGLPIPSLGDLPNPGLEPRSPALRVDSLPTEL